MELLWINCCISGKENSRTYKLLFTISVELEGVSRTFL